MNQNKSYITAAILLALTACSSPSDDDNGVVTPDCEKEKYFVTNNADNTVAAVELCNNTVTSRIPVGNNPGIWAYDETNNRIYVSNQDDGTVSVININTEVEVVRLNVGSGPRDITVDEERGIVYVANKTDDTVSVFNTTDHIIFNEDANSPITVGDKPHKIALNPITGKAYVAMDINDVYVIDGNDLSVAPTIIDLTPDNPTGTPTLNRIKFNEVNNSIYVTRTHSDADKDRVAIIDTSDDSVTITAVAEGGNRMAIDSAGNVYVASGALDKVTKISVSDETNKTVLSSGDNPDGIIVTDNGDTVYVSNRGANDAGNTVSVINVSDGTKTDITVNDNPVNISYSETLNRIYVSNRGTNNDGNTVSVIDTLTNTTTTITVGNNPRSSRIVIISD